MHEDYIKHIPEDLIDGALFIIEDYNLYLSHASKDEGIKELEYFQTIVNYYHLLDAFLNKFNFQYDKIEVNASIKNHDLQELYELFDSLEKEFILKHKERSILQSSEKYSSIFDSTFLYEFSEDDLERVQELINLLRDDISSSELFDPDHKRRLLKRLEKLQSELHKKVSDLDRFWGLIGDAGVAIGKFGNDVKPMVDRIREIADIVWRTQSRSEGLPSGSKIPFLGRDENNEKENL